MCSYAPVVRATVYERRRYGGRARGYSDGCFALHDGGRPYMKILHGVTVAEHHLLRGVSVGRVAVKL